MASSSPSKMDSQIKSSGGKQLRFAPSAKSGSTKFGRTFLKNQDTE